MKQKQSTETIFKEKLHEQFDSIFATSTENELVYRVNTDILTLENHTFNEQFLDKMLAGIKLAFLYIPGAMMIHFVGLFVKVLILHSESMPNFAVELSGCALVGTFLTMLGIGKLNDLNYLKVPASIFAT